MKKFIMYLTIGTMFITAQPVVHSLSKATINKDSKSVNKTGFLTTKWCAEKGMLTDCKMESIVCGKGECYKNWEFGDKEIMELVLYVHDDMKYYNIEVSGNLHLSHVIELGSNRNLITFEGKYDIENNIIVATKFEAPPPPKKSFFKGCL